MTYVLCLEKIGVRIERRLGKKVFRSDNLCLPNGLVKQQQGGN